MKLQLLLSPVSPPNESLSLKVFLGIPGTDVISGAVIALLRLLGKLAL